MLLVKVAVSRATRGSVTVLPDTGPNNPPAHSTSAAATIEENEATRRRYLWVADFAISFAMSRELIAVQRFGADEGVFKGPFGLKSRSMKAAK